MRSTSPDGLQLSTIVDGNPVATFVLNAEHVVTHWNQACEALTGVRARDVVGTKRQWAAFYAQERPVLADLVLSSKLEDLKKLYYSRCKQSGTVKGGIEAEDFFPDMGECGRWLSFTAAPLVNMAGDLCGAIETLQDISEQRTAEAALQENRNFLAQIVDGGSVATFVIDRHHNVTHWNRACEALTGMAAHQMLGTDQQWRAFYDEPRPVMADIVLDGANEKSVKDYYHGKYRPSSLIAGAFEAEDFFPAFGDSGRWVFFTAAPIRNAEGVVVGAIETLQDVSARKAAEIALRKSEERYRLISQLDALTQLFNSRHLHDQLAREIERSHRYKRPLALLMIDADHFKRINDTYGHLCGDHVLQELARTIKECLRNSDTAYRYGGEEFVALMPETNLMTALLVAERLRQRFADLPLNLGDQAPVHCTINVGVAEMNTDDTHMTLLQRADQAAYRAKARGRNCVEGG
ncbi:MAG: diguanylate cyclase [Betaproteobacteria bacterium]|nr:diguanylate cyclase [Betaproteobacteria bacterium]